MAPPPGSAARGDYYRWLFFAAGPFDTATTLATMDFTPPAFGYERAPWGNLDKVLATLEIVLADRDHLAGDRVSAADIYLGSLLEWAMRFGVVEPRPVFSRWCDALFARPAARRAEAIDEALFRGPSLTVIPGGRGA
jgi:glutathione S-transferase